MSNELRPRDYIGGDFAAAPLEPATNKDPESWWAHRPALRCATGRQALLALALNLSAEGRTLLLPDYLCEAQVAIFRRTDVDFDFYRLNEDLTPDLESLLALSHRGPVAVLMIHYFGVQPFLALGREIRQVLPEAILVADLAQAPFTRHDVSVFPFAFTSLRKVFPVVDGAEIFGDLEGFEPGLPQLEWLSLKHQAQDLKAQYLAQDELSSQAESRYQILFAAGEQELEKINHVVAMSSESQSQMAKLPVHQYAQQRRENYLALQSELLELQIEIPSVESDQVPLVLPLRIDERDSLRAHLAAQGVFCPVHWPVFAELPEPSVGRLLAREEMGLVLDHRYAKTHMKRQVAALRDFMNRHPNTRIQSLFQSTSVGKRR